MSVIHMILPWMELITFDDSRVKFSGIHPKDVHVSNNCTNEDEDG